MMRDPTELAPPRYAPRYSDGRIAMTPPDSWGAPTVIAFSAGGARSPSLVVTYEQLDASERISDKMQRQIELIRRVSPGAKVSPMTHRRVGGRTAVQMTLRWLEDNALVEQTSIYVAPGPEEPSRMTILIYTARQGADPSLFERLLATVTFARPQDRV
jgi:hypothetical protein